METQGLYLLTQAYLMHVCCRYGDGTIRLTVEQDILWPNVPEKNLEAMQKEPLFRKFKIFPGNLEGSLVSCTGAQVRSIPAHNPAFHRGWQDLRACLQTS